jgi:ABC-2 type transport system permease protein
MWKKLYFRPIHLVVSFLQPIFWLTIFGFLFEDKFTFSEGNYLSYLLPGVCAMTVLQSSAQSGILYIKDIQTGFFGRYNFVQQSKLSILFFKIFADYTRILFQILIILFIGWCLGISDIQFTFSGIGTLILSTFLFTVFYASLSCFIAIRTKTSELMATFVHLFNLPIVFTSTALIPNKNLPDWLEWVASYNPLSHLSELLREGVITASFESNVYGSSWIILICLSFLTFVPTYFYLRTIKYA